MSMTEHRIRFVLSAFVVGTGIPMGMGRKSPPRVLMGTGMGNYFPRGDGDGKAFPDGEFPVDILTLEVWRCHHHQIPRTLRASLLEDGNV
jgi:hypothetical protein